MEKSTTKEFIKKILTNLPENKQKFGYDRVVYVNNYTKVEIYCNECKKYFPQTPKSHLKGQGCPKCGKLKQIKSNTKTTEIFIKEAIEKHGDKYGYDKVVYIKSNIEVEIYCKKCQKYFKQKPVNHLQEMGCTTCGYKKNGDMARMLLSEFIKKAKSIHGNDYGYDKVVYVNCDIKVEIYCNECKQYFKQTPTKHINSKQGCNKCGCILTSKKNTKKTNVFILESKIVHSDKYGYDKVVYVHGNTNVEIYCKKHKKYFFQTPNSHLQGSGCPICNESKGELEVRKYLEKYGITYIRQKKFDNCINKRPLPFDFYLPDYNMCIEFNGKQHYELVNFGGKLTNEKMEENFKCIQNRDKIKKKYCKNNNIFLIEIPYLEFKNIKKIITNINTSI